MEPKTILGKFTKMKTLPPIAIQLTQMISDDRTTINEFENVIKNDPTLVLRLLKLVNSAYYSLRRKVDSISQALVFTGLKNLRSMIVLAALKDAFKDDDENPVLSRKNLWFHCAAVSICSQLISERIFLKKGEDAFLCGILHDIGMIVEYQVIPDLFIDFYTKAKETPDSMIAIEKEIIGTDHCELGYLMAVEWKLPADVQKGISQHHSTSSAIQPKSATGILQIAEYLVSRIGYSDIPGIKAKLNPALAEHLKENIDEYKTLARDLSSELEKAKEIYELE